MKFSRYFNALLLNLSVSLLRRIYYLPPALQASIFLIMKFLLYSKKNGGMAESELSCHLRSVVTSRVNVSFITVNMLFILGSATGLLIELLLFEFIYI